MMNISNHTRYERHLRERTSQAGFNAWLHEAGLPMLLFGSIGAVGWAIRGTTGWGGIDGVIVPGLTWGVLWCYLCHRKGVDARAVVLWLGLGLSLGGELGYGQYVSWIQGIFYVGDRVLPIAPWWGYAWFAICGIGKAALGGMVLGWALSERNSTAVWCIRTCLAGVLLVLLFNLGEDVLGTGVIDWLGAWFAGHCPWLLFPNADLEQYAGTLDKHLGRTIYTNTQNFAVLVWWCVALLVAALQRDRTTLFTGGLLGAGFGAGLALAAVWCLGYGCAPKAWDWWKLWELNAGLYLGLLYAIVLNWALRRLDRQVAEGIQQRPAASLRSESVKSLYLALVGFTLVFAAGFEYFFWTGLMLAVFCAGVILWAAWPLLSGGLPEIVLARRRALTFSFSAFLLVFILLHGVSARAVVLLNLCAEADIGQYAWPSPRVALFVPPAVLLLCAALLDMRRRLNSVPEDLCMTQLPERMFDLLCFTGVVGAASIWPDKTGVIYAVFTGLAVCALARLNRQFDAIDAGLPRAKKGDAAASGG